MATTPAHILADELCESWINGNRATVLDELASMPQPAALATLGCMLAQWFEAGSSARTHDANSLVKRLADRAD